MSKFALYASLIMELPTLSLTELESLIETIADNKPVDKAQLMSVLIREYVRRSGAGE